jgi:class 3 adenylate cyclase
VEIGDMTVGRTVQEPGWRWSEHVRPVVGGEWCEARHVGIVISGRIGADLRDGSSVEFGPDDVYDLPPGHDGYTIGDEPAVLIEWAGLRAIARHRAGFRGRVLSALLFTDLVDSTASAARMGDGAWREVLAQHFQAARSLIERFGGREIKTTGDGMLAAFEAPVAALGCAAAIRAAAQRDDLRIRAGVHVGEIDTVGSDVHGVAVHEAARIMAAAAPDEILVSETTRLLIGGSSLSLDDRGMHDLKGLPEPRHLFALRDLG